jgi:hypothetical protein
LVMIIGALINNSFWRFLSGALLLGVLVVSNAAIFGVRGLPHVMISRMR